MSVASTVIPYQLHSGKWRKYQGLPELSAHHAPAAPSRLLGRDLLTELRARGWQVRWANMRTGGLTRTGRSSSPSPLVRRASNFAPPTRCCSVAMGLLLLALRTKPCIRSCVFLSVSLPRSFAPNSAGSAHPPSPPRSLAPLLPPLPPLPLPPSAPLPPLSPAPLPHRID